jgi:protein O-GlcNAc transferase
LRTGHFDKAAALACKALEINPKARGGVHRTLGRALIDLGRPEEAIVALEKCLEASGAAGYYHMARAHQQLRQYEDARKNYTAALRINPHYAEACYGLSVASARLGQAEDAAGHRRKFQELRAANLKRRKDAGMLRRPQQAARDCAATAHTNAGAVYYDNKRVETAQRHWLRAADIDPGNIECRRNLVSLHRKAGSHDKALATMEQLIGIEPKNATFRWQLSVLLAEVNRFDDALSAIEEAKRLNPNNVTYLQTYHQLLLKKHIQ